MKMLFINLKINKMQNQEVDVLANKPRKIDVLTLGFVQLVDCMPRLIDCTRTMETAIVEAARVSTGQGLKDVQTDNNLIKYLFKNRHTSPFEQIEFKFVIKCPLFVKNQLIRHRTFCFNEFSQRYSEIKDQDGDSFYHPSSQLNGIRSQDKINKQSSNLIDVDNQLSIKLKVEEIERSLQNNVNMYKDLISRGVARETARFCLSNSTWTTLYMKGNLHNFLHFLQLRLDAHAQYETRVYAQAIFDLIKPLVPITIDMFENSINTIILSTTEIEAIKNKTPFIGTKSEEVEFKDKCRKLGL